MCLLLSVDFGEGFDVDHLIIVVFDGPDLPYFPSLLIVTLLGRDLLGLQLQVAQGAQEPPLFP